MATIPASDIVKVVPAVLSAGGQSLVMSGLFLTTNYRIPATQLGVTQSFADAATVSNFFGAASTEAEWAAIYFNGFDNSYIKPAVLKFARFPAAAIGAYMRTAPVNGYTIAQIQGMSGSLTVTVDNVARVAASINLSAATSFSAAAALIASGLNGSLTSQAVVTGSIAASTSSVTGSIAANVLTVTAVASGVVVPGTIFTGTGVAANTRVTSQLSGDAAGVGTYAVTGNPQTVASTALSGTYGTMTVSAVTSGTLSVGQTLSGAGVTADTLIAGLGTGTGLVGTYYVTPSQTAASTTITANPTNVTVTYDSQSGSFFINSSIVGGASQIGYATGTLAATLYMTSATGAVLSQGFEAQTPSGFMTAVIGIDRNWASFTTILDPDHQAGNGNVQKLAFAAWNNSQLNNYCYIPWDTDASPTTASDAPASLGQLVKDANYSGTAPFYDSDISGFAAFECGAIASINFSQHNGRTTLAFRSQTGLVPDVTNINVAHNLTSNLYNYYGVWATAAQDWQFEYTGLVSGPFTWLDSYVNQIWLNNAMQQALMSLLVNTPSIPYNQDGYTLIKAACLDPIIAALNFGAIRKGITLSQQQIAQLANAAGLDISQPVIQNGYYLQVLDPGALIRGQRGSPVCNLFYADGQSVHRILITSTEIM